MYYQFVLRVENYLPMTMKTRYRSYDRAIKMLNTYIKEGYSGCMVTITKENSLLECKEF